MNRISAILGKTVSLLKGIGAFGADAREDKPRTGDTAYQYERHEEPGKESQPEQQADDERSNAFGDVADESARAALGNRAARLVEENRGMIQKTVQLLV